MQKEEIKTTTPTAEEITAAKAIMDQVSALPGTGVLAEVTPSTGQPEGKTAVHDAEQGTPAPAPPTPQLITITPEQYAQYMSAVRDGFIAKKVNAMGNEYTSRRNTLILRKVAKLYPDLVSDEEVVAYYDIYKMREAVQGDSKKIIVPDSEVEAYLELWTGESTPSLEAIEDLTAKKSLS